MFKTLALLLLATAVNARFEIPVQLPTVPALKDVTDMVNINGSLVELPQIMYFPDDNGDPMPGQIYGNASAKPVLPSDVFFKLYTRHGPPEGEVIVPGDVESLRRSHFNASHRTYLITHGFVQSIESQTIRSLKEMYLGFHEGNVIAIDWHEISKNWLYFIVKMQLMEVGQFVAGFTAFLVREGGVDLSKVHLVGHSLGAHVVGIAGKNIQVMVGNKAGRITGLDPAGPLFSVLDKARRLDRDDAEFVDVIHTCGGWLGMSAPIGHADFYPNGGTMRQPGCALDFVMAGVCSHSRSWEFFAESISTHRFASKSCTTWVHYKMGNCVSGTTPMGQHTHSSASGNYFLETANFPPYAMG